MPAPHPGGPDPAAPARVVLVDDHVIVRQGLAAVLAGAPSIEVVGEASDPVEALRVIAATRPDLALLDVRLGTDDATGLQLCQRLTRPPAGQGPEIPPVKVLMLSAFVSERLVLEAIRSGAKGYVLKDVDTEALVRAVDAVRRGESVFDNHAAAAVVRSLSSAESTTQSQAALSDREREVLALVGRGLSNREIGERLYVSPTTVKFHLRNIMAKVGVHRRAELAFLVGQGERMEDGP